MPVGGLSRQHFRHRGLMTLAAMTLLIAASAAAGKEPLANPQAEVHEVLRLVPVPAHGASLFNYCAACHETRSNGLPEGWVPSIRGQHPRYLAKQLVDFRHSLRWDTRMEPVAKGHGLRGLQDIADVVAFLAAQPADWNVTAESPPRPSDDRRFYRTHCGSCHGTKGAGDNSRSIPRIAGQDFAYLLRQLHDVVDGRRPNMRKQHFRALEDLDVVQLVSLSCYVSHLGEGAENAESTEAIGLNDPAASRSARPHLMAARGP